MKLKTSEGPIVDVEVAGVAPVAPSRLCVAPQFFSTCAGRRVSPHRWCNGEVRGRVALETHENAGAVQQRPTGDLAGFTAEDMAALQWSA